MPSIVDDANGGSPTSRTTSTARASTSRSSARARTALQTLQEKVVGGTSDIVDFGGQILKTVVTAGLGLLLVIVLSVYMLIYGERIGAIVRSVMPPGDGTEADDFPARIQRAVGGYLRGQLLFSLAMGTGAGLGLYVSASPASSPTARPMPSPSARGSA